MRRDKILIGVRIIVAVFILGVSAQISYADTEMNIIRRIQETEDVATRGARRQIKAITSRPVQKYRKGNSRDPFQGLIEETPSSSGAVESPMPALTIQGVVWGTSLPQAIINGEVMKIGDTIDKARIIDINRDGVVIFFGGREHTLLSPGMSGMKTLEEKIEKNKGGQDETG